jgi:hypothetical protein
MLNLIVKKVDFQKTFLQNDLTFVDFYFYFSENILVKYLKEYFNLLDLRSEKEKASH